MWTADPCGYSRRHRKMCTSRVMRLRLEVARCSEEHTSSPGLGQVRGRRPSSSADGLPAAGCTCPVHGDISRRDDSCGESLGMTRREFGKCGPAWALALALQGWALRTHRYTDLLRLDWCLETRLVNPRPFQAGPGALVPAASGSASSTGRHDRVQAAATGRALHMHHQTPAHAHTATRTQSAHTSTAAGLAASHRPSIDSSPADRPPKPRGFAPGRTGTAHRQPQPLWS